MQFTEKISLWEHAVIGMLMLKTGDNGSGRRVLLLLNDNGDTAAGCDIDDYCWVNILFTFISSLRILYKIF